MKNIMMRPVVPADIDQLQRISRVTFADTFASANTAADMKKHLDEAYAKEQLLREMAQPGTSFYFGLINGACAGYLKLNVDQDQSEVRGAGTLEIERIYILPEFKRQGLGRVFLQAAEKLAQDLNKERIWLGVWEENEAALAFYKQMGFEQVSQHVFVLGDDRQTDLIMEKVLV